MRIAATSVKAVLVFDGDNTLWDTDAIFRSAQLALLKQLHARVANDDPEELLTTLRGLDEYLGKLMGRYEYDFRLLSIAATYLFLRSANYHQAAEKALSPGAMNDKEVSIVAEEAFQAFQAKMNEIPSLYPDTELVLSSILQLRGDDETVVNFLLSEGDPQRLQRILTSRSIQGSGFFDAIMITAKSREVFEDIKNTGLERLRAERIAEDVLLVAVGDSLQRDIRFAKAAGFLTVYKPSGFKGWEEPKEEAERPTFVIERLADLLGILRRLGLPLRAAEGQPKR